MLDERIANNLERVRDRMAAAAERAGRSVSEIRLIAISKTFGPEHVRAAAAAGQVDFGENRVQEALDKIASLSDLPLRWHLVGHLQSNKARKAVGPFDCIHSVDRIELLQRLDAAAVERDARIRILVQADLAGEETKHGAAPDDIRALLAAASKASGLDPIGLMLLPPFYEDPEAVRPWFRRLREMRDGLTADGVAAPMVRELSMGMSHDFEVAIEEGSTIIRVGSAIFGERHV